MHLFREVMDKEIVDRQGYKSGKVDDLLLEVRAGELPIVRGIVTGQSSLSSLLGDSISRMATWLRVHGLGFAADQGPAILDWQHVTKIDVVVHIDRERDDAGLMESEEAIWHRWIKRLPYAER